MELYIGGFAQGKLEYVTNKYNCAKVYDGKNYKNLIQNVENKMITEKIVILDHFNDIIRNLFESELENAVCNAERLTEWLICSEEKYKYKLVIISDEIGCGIVPMEKLERGYRECCGRMLIKLADRADIVERIICGLPQKIT